MLGRSFLSSMLLAGSKIEYDTKKMAKEACHSASVNFKSLSKPAIFALPILLLSKNETRYSRQSHGSKFKSIFDNSARSCH